jgi:hypothetical protein
MGEYTASLPAGKMVRKSRLARKSVKNPLDDEEDVMMRCSR